MQKGKNVKQKYIPRCRDRETYCIPGFSYLFKMICIYVGYFSFLSAILNTLIILYKRENSLICVIMNNLNSTTFLQSYAVAICLQLWQLKLN